MPYTPPAPQSPAFSQVTSPSHSRTPSHGGYSESPPRSPGPNGHLPRSSSQSYFHKPRRGPSHLGHTELSPFAYSHDSAEKHGLSLNTNVRQSPPPQTDSVMPPGAMISPPDSTQNSSDEEDASAGKAKDDKEMTDLEEAVRRSITLKREGSPDNDSPTEQSPDTIMTGGAATPPRLSETARKISHSRSSTETSIFNPTNDHMTGQSNAASDNSEEDDEDEDLMFKPPLVRKKSGELVKPAIRPSRRKHSSMPGTPTYSKAVHFNDDIEQVRHFLSLDRPIAVSAGTSPVETLDDHDEFPFTHNRFDLEICLNNFPRSSLERDSQLVRVDSLTLSTDQKSLIGSVAVANVAFHKFVAARFTFDYWKTTSEVAAEFSNNLKDTTSTAGYDLFKFNIKVADQSNVDNKTLLICVRYSVDGKEHWDNNAGANYQVEFTKKPRPQPASSSPSVGVPPRSRRSSGSRRGGRPVSMPASLDDEYGSSFDGDRGFQLKKSVAKKPMFPDTPPTRRTNANGQQFGSRYDFGASLTAALNQAQAALGDRSGLEKSRRSTGVKIDLPASVKEPTGPPALSAELKRTAQTDAADTESPRNDSLLATKQSVDSRAYQDFVSKFCFFGTKASPTSPSETPPLKGPGASRDGADDMEGLLRAGPGPEMTNAVNAMYARKNALNGFPGLISSEQVMSSAEARSSSPRPQAGRHVSETSYGYPYSNENRNGFWSGTTTPPAIRS